ncbi:uncharacterized protein LTR77_006092 [Saxophila tyrrhenica]|uniref:Nitrate reductase [NADPH] n=1 Tax=Saxophila tyrrhenica TaxID=1690608 RepID=A0AAV9P7R4_9PEZI|nr:hypothetical protein LTR77_006092 [Saxophila tyrrhenica]
MPPTLRPIVNLLQAGGVEGPQFSRAVIGPARGRLAAFFQTDARSPRVKRWQELQQQDSGTRGFHSTVRAKKPFPPPPPTPSSRAKTSNAAPLLGVLFGASALAVIGTSFIPHKDVHVEDDSLETDDHVSINDTEDTRKIRLSEVPKHNRDADRKWIIRENAVYDITDFIEQHPGGEVILRACGGSVDPYWKIFSIHNKQQVYDILNEYQIGEIDERDLDDAGHVDWTVLGDEAKNHIVDDPFMHDPERDSNLVFRTEKPCNAETPGSMLTDFLTPLKLFFVRNHLWVPQMHESPHSVTIELSDGEEKTYSLADLKAKFREHTITVTLQCSGNRRAHMSKAALGPTSGLQWDIGAIGTAEFSGVRLRDVLKDAGYCVDGDCPAPCQAETEECDKHVQFISPGDTYAVSIPLQTAVNPQADVLLAWDMNGEPINRDHGGPLRAIVPGTTAARSVKWLGKVSISSDESPSQWQQRDYKCFGPNMKQTQVRDVDWECAQAMQETPVQSAITNVVKANGDKKTTVQGFAYSGGGRGIVRVDVSADGGKTWKQANLHKDQAKGSRRWAWTMWSIEWPKDDLVHAQQAEFVVKAVDDSYNTQPETFEGTWNFRGLCANAWNRMTVPAEAL